MIFFGHLGCGTWLVSPFAGNDLGRAGLIAILTGCIAPDILDKSLLYTVGGPESWISGSRTFGHSLLFLGVLAAASALLRSRGGWLFTLAALLHVAIDHLTDLVAILAGATDTTLAEFAWGSDRLVGLCWPLLGLRFPVGAPVSPIEHVLGALTPLNLLWEALGLALLVPILWRAFVVRPSTLPASHDAASPVAPSDRGR